MTISKVMATHMAVGGMGEVLHIELRRHDVIKRLADFPQDEGTQDSILGMDFPVLARKERSPGAPYFRSRIWLGVDLLKDAMVVHEHEVDVSDEPIGDLGLGTTTTTTPPALVDDLSANL